MHLTTELFKSDVGIEMVHIPYKGGQLLMTDFVAGNVAVAFPSIPSVWPQVRSGKLRALAVTSAKRIAQEPNLPTVAETVPGFESIQWWGIFAPASTPKDIVSKLNAKIQEILADDDVRKILSDNAAEPIGGSSSDSADFLRRDYEKWRKVIDRTGLR